MKENNEGGDSENNEDETVENVNVEKEMAGLIDIFNEQKKRQETKNVLTTENSEAVTEKKSSKRYQEKMQALQKYIPALRRVMDNMDPGPNMEVQKSCRQKLEIVYTMIEQPKKDKQLKYECLEKLERILRTIATRVKVKKSSRAGSPSLKSLLTEDEEDSPSSANKSQAGPSGTEVKRPNTEKLVTEVTVVKVKDDKKTEKVPNNDSLLPSSKISVNKKGTLKNNENNFDLLFTPDPNVSKIRPGTSSEYPRSFTESGTPRHRIPYAGRETRPAHSFTPRGERFRAPYPENTERFRAPYPESSERFRAPYPESSERFRAPYPENTERFRAPYPESSERFRAPYPESSERFRAPYPESSERFRAPYPESSERFRAPYPESTERFRAPYPESTERFRDPYLESTERFRDPYLESAERFRYPYSDSTERFRAPYPDNAVRIRTHYDSSERYRAPYPESGIRYRALYYDIMEKHRPAFTDIEERYYEKPKSGKKIDKEADTTESSRLRPHEKSIALTSSTSTKSSKEKKLDRTETDTNRSFGSRPHEKSGASSSSTSTKSGKEKKLDRAETDTKKSFGSRPHEKCSASSSSTSQKSGNEKNIDRLAETDFTESFKSRPHEKSIANSSSSISTTSSKERCREKSGRDSTEPPSGNLKVKNPNGCSRSGSSSSDINIESTLRNSNILDNMDDLRMQQQDLEKLTQSTQQLKSHLNNRLKNMQAQRLLMASTNKDVTTTCRDSTIKNNEVSGGSREDKNVTPEKFVRSKDELQTEPTNEEASAFIDNLMSNLTTKFGLKRGPLAANEQQEKSTNKPETTVVCKSNASGKKVSEILERNGHETHFNMIRKPLLSAEDRAEVISTVKQILLEKAKSLNSTPTVNLNTEKLTSLPSVSNNDSLKISAPAAELISTGHGRAESKTTPNVPNADDNNWNKINIPGLDGIIPLALERGSVSFHESMSNKTKDHPLVTKVLKGLVNQSSQENCVKLNFEESETVQGGIICEKPKFNLNDNVGELKQNQKLNSSLNEDANKTKPNQSLRSKLTGEISTLHKVGTPCGGALRGLVKRDKMMPSGQIASLKPGTLYDLISEDKLSRSATKAKTRPQLQPNSISDTHVSVNISSETLKTPICSNEVENSCLSGMTKNPDDILSKLSENDLKKIITDNIGALPTPPNLPFLNNAVSTRVSSDISMNANSPSSGISWNNQGSSMHQINMHSQNVIINNINVLPLDNTSNNSLINQQSGSNWATSDVSDAWKNNTHMKDPRRESQLANNVTLLSHQSMESSQHLFSPVPDAGACSFEKPTYSSSYVRNTEPFKGSENENSRDPFYFNSFNPPVVLQTDPYTSPCYDGSATPDPYRPDPYTMSLNGSFEKQGQACNSSTEQLNAFSRPSLLGDSPTTFESHTNFGREITQRPPLVRTPPLPVPRPSLLGIPSLSQEQELYSNFIDNQQSHYNDPRNIRRAPSTYAVWKAEKNMAEGRNLNSFPLCDGSNYHHDKTIDDHRNFNRYRWTRETASSSYDHRGSHYSDASCRNQQKETEVVKKLSARDPRRKSIEDNSERKESLPISTPFSKTESNNQVWCSRKSVKVNGMDQLGNVPNSTATSEKIRGRSSQRDPRTRERTPPRGRSASRDQGRHYGSRERSLSRGPNRGRSPSRRSDDLTNKLDRNEKSKDTYSSPLDQLYANTTVPKTGLGYGFQRFRIPKWNKGSFDNSSKHHTKENHSVKDSSEDYHKSKNSSDRELEIINVENEAHQATSESAEKVVNALKEKSDQKKDIDIQPTNSDSDDDKDVKIDCHSAVEELSESNNKEKKEELKLNTRSRNKEITFSSKVVSTEEELEQSPCRRSKRLIKKKRGRPPKAKSLKKQFEVEEQESSSDTNHLPVSNDVEDKSDGYDMTFIDKLTELKSSSDNEKSNKSAAKETTNELKNTQASPDHNNKSLEKQSDNEEHQSKLPFNTNVELSNLEVKNKYVTISESSLDQKVLFLESAINKTEEISDPSTSYNDLPLPTKSCNSHEHVINNVSIDQLTQKMDNMNKKPNEGTPDLTYVVRNAEIVEFSGEKSSVDTVETIAKQSERNLPSSGGSQIQKLIEIPEIAKISSEITTEATKESTPNLNTGNSVNTCPEIKIIKQVELLEEMIGIKLTPDKIRKMAEILYVPEPKENITEEQPQEKTISDANKSVKVVTSDVKSKDSSNEINKTLSELRKVELNDQKTLVKNGKQFETTPVTDTDDGQEVVKSTKAKVLKKRKNNTSKTQITKKDFVNENATKKPKRKYKNELDRLQDDISKYHDSEAIAAASGPRQCRLQKEKNQSIGKTTQAKPTQNMKTKLRKCKEDEFDDSEGASIKDGSSKCQEDELDELEEDSMKEESNNEDSTEEEPIENKYYQSYSSSDDDPIHLYSEKMKSKYGYILEEAKGEQSSSDVNSRKSKGNSEAELITSSVNAKYSECQKPVSNENYGSIVKEKAGSDSGNKSGNVQLKGLGENNQFGHEQCAEKLLDTESNFGKEGKPNQILTNNLLQKYALKKQRKKSCWSAGIIRKKTKSKKTDSPVSSPNEDNIDTSGLDVEDEEDIAVNEAPDLNYYQQGDTKATKCKLCSFYGKSIVTHYAITHPKDEVLISRMSPKAAEIAIKESAHFFSLSDKKKNDYSSLFECRICYLKFCKFSSFFEHMALHTGEFRHECCKCGYRTSTRGGILKHYQSHNVKNANNKSCRVLYKEPVDKTYLCGYLCSLCNYFQISQTNVKRHVENVHEIQDFNHVVKINFSKVTFNESDIEFEQNDMSSANSLPEKTLGIEQVGESSDKRTFGTDAEDEVTSGNQILSETFSILPANGSSEGEAPENSRKLSKSNSGGSLSDPLKENTTESMTNSVCSVADLTYTDSRSFSKDTKDIADLKKSLISQDVASTSQNTKYPDIKNSAQTIIEKCDSNVDATVSKERENQTLTNNVEDTSGIREDLVSDSLQKGARDLCFEKNTQNVTTDIEDNCSADVDASALKDTFISNAYKETLPMADAKKNFNVVVGDLTNTEVSDPDKEKEQKAPMLIQNDWFLSLCKNISEINCRYLIESVSASVSSRVENLKFKVNSPNIADEVSRRCISDTKNALLLNDFLQMSVSFKVERKGNVSREQGYESLNQKKVTDNDVEETTPARRQLPDRTCKGVFIKQVGDKERDNELSSDDEDEVEIYKVVKDAGQHEDNWDDDVIVKEEIVPETFTDELKGSTIASENNSQFLPCLRAPVQNYLTKNASRKPLSIQDKLYISSLPPNSNFSEFTHVMKQISQVSLKVSEIKQVKVGGLKAHPDGYGVIFSCYVKIFNKECGFQTSDLEVFGQHVNMSHHTSHWNGVCCSCLVHFVRDPNSHDKVSVNTQSKAFCHLVREHLTFTKKSTKSATRGSLTSNEAPASEEAPPPRLRVRRFSGDKLSGTDAENILPQPTVEVTGAGQEENGEPSLTPHRQEPVAETHPQSPLPTEDEISRGIKLFKPHTNTKGAKSAFKLLKIYNAMCLHHKLRHLYKCMGAKCSFTTMSLKEFSRHFDDHKEIYVMNADDDPHRGFWNVCAYCLTPHATSKELCIHIRKEHGICTMQCSKCFYRAKSIANVHFHHTVEHEGELFNVLLCEQGEMNLPPFIEKPFTEFVSAFRCSLKESCSLFTYMLHTFCNHLKVAHPDDLRCHLCMDAYPNIKGLLQHYCEKHGTGLFQCLFCTFGASTEHEIRLHLCCVHPSTDPKALQRTDNTLKQNTGLTNRESIKRLMFYKDQDKLMRYVSYPSTEQVPVTSVVSPSASPPRAEPTPQFTRPTILRTEQEPATSVVSLSTSPPRVEPTPRFTRPTILRTKRPAGEPPNPTKMLIISPQESSGEGVKSVPVRVAPPSPLPPSSYSDDVSSTDTAPSTEPSDNTSTSAAERDTSTPDSRVSNTSTSNSNCETVDVNYFKCGNKGCTFEASTSAPLKNHLVICDQARQSQKLSCAFCNRVFKQVGSLVEHLRVHGPERYACSMCPFKASLLSRVNSHMKACHHVFTTTVVPVDPSKRDSEKDYFIINGKEKRRGGEKPGSKWKARSEMKKTFSPEELDDVPKAAIFHNSLGCRLCSYGTKVRSNLVRHLQQHSAAGGAAVPQEEVVNPVPDKTEKMFDKMMNLAGSSHKKKPGPENTKDETAVGCMYKYVPDQDRYMCHVKECGYRTLSETMLRDHISVIHKDETYYVCPHCIEEVDVIPIPIDQLSMHLKLHDCPVFKCAYCHFCSHIRGSIERHTEVLHPGEPLDVQAVRLTKPDNSHQPALREVCRNCYVTIALCRRRSIERHTEVLHPGEPLDVQAVRLTKPDNSHQPAPKFCRTDKSDEQGEEWYCCNHCVFKTKKKKIMLQHGVMEHKMAKPFKCSSCVYECLTEQMFGDHFNTCHPDKDCELIALYKKVTEVKKPVLPPIPPLWKRDAKRLKLIRGIKLDEKGDAPPPVVTATTGIKGLDVLELKFGHFGKPLGTNFMCPRCSMSFVCKNRQEMKEHLFKDLEYNPILCKICKIESTQRTKVMKHINKVHNVEWDRISESLDINVNEELESWVENVLTRQQSLMSEMSPTQVTDGAEPPRKRRRSSVEASGAPALEPPASPPPLQSTSDTESLHLSQESVSSVGSVSDDKDDHKGREREKRKRDKCPSRHRFSCEYCDVTTKYKHSIILHCKKVHQDLPPKVNTLDKTMEEKTDAYNCMYCNCTALNLNNLKHHWTHTHKNSGLNFLFRNTVFNTELEHECYWCKKRSDLESLEEHCRDDHSADQRFLVVSISVPKYKCAECHLVFKSVDLLKRHFSVSHPSKKFCYIVINTQRPISPSDQSSSSPSSRPESPPKPKSTVTYKCFNCPYVSPRFWPVVKHMHGHFVTLVCTECESWFPSSLGFNSHMLSKHPSSSVKPHVLRGSETDIENAKKNIIIIPESGVKRKITEEELAEAEKENKPEEDVNDMYMYDEPLEVRMSPPPIKETARKSTGSPKYRSTPPELPSPPLNETQKSPSRPKKALFKIRRKKLNLYNTFVTVKSHDKVIRLPAETFRRLVNLDAESMLKTNAI